MGGKRHVDGRGERSDSRLNVARYRVDRLTRDLSDGSARELSDGSARELSDGSAREPGDEADTEPDGADSAGQPTMDQRAQYVEISIAQAMRRGDFDNLPGAGKPLRNLSQTHDPNWWIRQKIENERLTGLGPPALTLRTEDAALEARMDAAPSENAVREMLDDFNKRVIEARRQLQGGPPVVTPTRDIDAEIVAWRTRRSERYRVRDEARRREAEAWDALTWRERWRVRRRG